VITQNFGHLSWLMK